MTKRQKSGGIKFIDHKFRKKSHILSEELDDEKVLYDPKTQNTYALNPMAAVIWDLCDGEHTPAQIAEEVLSVLEADQSQVLSDVIRTVNEFLEKDLVEVNSNK